MIRLKKYGVKTLKINEIDSFELLELCKERTDCKTIYDIGANRGTWSVLASAIFPHSHIFAFEPLDIKKIPEFYQNNIFLHQVALGAENKISTIHITNDIDSSSLLAPTKLQQDIFDSFEKNKEKITVNRLDSFIINNSLPSPELIKLDVQGYELEVLKGAESLLNNVNFIIMEVSFKPFYQNQPLFNEIIAYMDNFNFKVKAFGTNTVLGKEILQTDILFEKNK